MTEEDMTEIRAGQQLLDTVEEDLLKTITKLETENPCVDYRSDTTLIPLRVAYMDSLIKDLITNCQFPLNAVLKVRDINSMLQVKNQ